MALTGLRSVFLVAVFGCAAPTAGAPTAARHPGDVRATPRLDVLPSRDASRAPMTERMRFAWLLTEESLDLSGPPPPQSMEASHLMAWNDAVLTDWLQRKSHTMTAARRELEGAAEEAHHQRVMAGALVGLLYEDVADYLQALPIPEDLASEPEIAAIYRDIVDFWASPYREHARRAYRACAANAIQPDHMRHWSSFCAGRADRLAPARGDRFEPGTRVSVSVDP